MPTSTFWKETASADPDQTVATVGGGLAQVDPVFFRAIYDFGREHYAADSATYHVSARLDRAPL